MTNSHSAYNQWLQYDIARQNIDLFDSDIVINLNNNQSWMSRRARNLAAVLSPDCRVACLASKTHASLFAINAIGQTASRAFSKCIKGIEDAVLTDDLLAVLTTSTVEIYQYHVNDSRTQCLRLLKHPLGTGKSTPVCIAMADSASGVRLAIGGNGSFGPEIQLHRITTTVAGTVLEALNVYSTPAIDNLKNISFCPAGEVIAAVTDSSRCLAWHIRTNIQGAVLPTQPIAILAPTNVTNNGHGMTSASIFRSPSTKQKFVLCSVDRAHGSSQRCQIAPLPPNAAPVELADAAENQHSMTGELDPAVDYAEPVIAAGISSNGQYAAVVEKEGYLKLFRVLAHPNGGLFCEAVPHSPTYAIASLCSQTTASPTSIRILRAAMGAAHQFQVVAIDRKGRIVIRTYT